MPCSSTSPRCQALSSVPTASRGVWHRQACARASTTSAARASRGCAVNRQCATTSLGRGGSRVVAGVNCTCRWGLSRTNTPRAPSSDTQSSRPPRVPARTSSACRSGRVYRPFRRRRREPSVTRRAAWRREIPRRTRSAGVRKVAPRIDGSVVGVGTRTTEADHDAVHPIFHSPRAESSSANQLGRRDRCLGMVQKSTDPWHEMAPGSRNGESGYESVEFCTPRVAGPAARRVSPARPPGARRRKPRTPRPRSCAACSRTPP